MKVTATRTVDEIGRILLPRELRKRYQIQADTPIDIFDSGGQIVLRKAKEHCVFCGEEYGLKQLKQTHIFICSSCQNKISEMV